MKHYNKRIQRSGKTIAVLFALFLAIMLRDATTGTLSLPLTLLNGGVLASLALISVLVAPKD
jgi:hypothetical protein